METLVSNALLLLYRNWYALPLRATRNHLDTARATLAAALRTPGVDGLATLSAFLATANGLPGSHGGASGLILPSQLPLCAGPDPAHAEKLLEAVRIRFPARLTEQQGGLRACTEQSASPSPTRRSS